MTPKLIPKIIFAWLICLAFNLTVWAERLPVKIYTSADGLGSSFIDYLMRDSRGFMWFCTRDGLSRFDGSHFVTYRLGDKDSPPGIESIYQTRDGNYWIGTTGGLYRLSPDALSQPNKSTGGRPFLNAQFMGPSRGQMVEDQAGDLWYSDGEIRQIRSRESQKLELGEGILKLPSELGPLTVFRMRATTDGCLWAITSVGLVRRLPDGRRILYPHKGNDRLGRVSLVVDSSGLIWALWGRDFYVVKPPPLESLPAFEGISIQPLQATAESAVDSDQIVSLPTKFNEILRLTDKSGSDLIRRLFMSRDGHIWLSSDKGLSEFDGKSFHSYGEAQGLPAGMAEMSEDLAGNLWIAGQAGLLELYRGGMTTYSTADGLNSPRLFALNESVDGTIYVANGNYYISRFDGERFNSIRPAIPEDEIPLWTSRYAFLSRANEWWILGSSKLYRFAANNLNQPLSTYTSKDGLNADEMFQAYEDKLGDIWVSVQPLDSKKRALARFNRSENKFHTFSEADGFPSGKSVSCFAEDKQGTLWLGFYEGGLARFSNQHFTQFTNADGVPKGLITDLLVDSKDRLWLTSSNDGVARIDDLGAARPGFVTIDTDNGLSSDNSRTITEDRYGNVYVGTVRGVDRISPDNKRIRHYSVGDGLAADFVVDSHCDRQGTLWFVTTNGLSRLVPTAEEGSVAPEVWLGGFRVAGIAQALSELGEREIKTIELTHTQNNLQLDFFSLDFHAGEVMRYQYRLEGADQDWSAPSEQRTVNFANLRPGAYRFLVRAVNTHGVVSAQPAVFSFKILPPVWQRRWFIILTAFVILGLLYLFYRYRVARLREVNTALADAKRAEEKLGQAREERLIELGRVRTRIATDLHDDIGASLTQIAILSEVARQQSMKGNGAVLEPLKSIVNVSNELVETMSDIVWAINPQKDHLQDLIQRMRRFASDILSAQGIMLEFQAPSFAPEIPLGANARREVLLIFKESLTNIVKHAAATQVRIEFDFSNVSLTLKITDNGLGFEDQEVAAALFTDQKGGHGILSMKKRAIEINGALEISSKPGQGTEVVFTLPLSEPSALTGGTRR